MTLPGITARANQLTWAGICILALGQAGALAAGVAGTRLAFSSLHDGALSAAALLLIAGAAVALATLRLALGLLAERVGQRYTAEVRKALLARAMAATPQQIAHRRRGYLMMRLTGDMTALKDGLARSLPPMVQAGALIPAAVITLFWIDPRFGTGALALCGFALGIGLLTAPQLRLAHVALRQERARLAADLAERLPIAPDLARLGRRDRELSRLSKASDMLRRRAERRMLRAEFLRVLPGILAGIVAVGILYDGASRNVAAGELAAALAALGLLAHTLTELAAALDRLAGWQVARSKLATAFSSPVGKAPGGRDELERLNGRRVAIDIQLPPGLAEPLSLRLEPGGVGRVHAADPGWLAAVLTGQTRDDRASICVNGVPIDRLTPGSVRRSIGLISPDPVLLKGSIRRNLCLGLTDRPSDELLLKRISKAGLTESLQRFGGLDGPVGEGGRLFAAIDRLHLSALQVAVQRPGLMIVRPAGMDIPREMEAFLKAGSATVLHLQ